MAQVVVAETECWCTLHTDARSCALSLSPRSELGPSAMALAGSSPNPSGRRKMTASCACRQAPVDVQHGDCNLPHVGRRRQASFGLYNRTQPDFYKVILNS
jgi:hypothetical protein